MSSRSSVTASEPLSSLWKKAAILGSLWAAFEILWGSLLHSLRIPFAGMMLAAGGVFLMAAGRRLWPEKGLIWRAAVVCAMMKSISPSSVILGPMAGILAEGLLMEGAFRLLGGNPVAAAVGGALAVCWTLAQKLIALLLTYGPDLAQLYLAAVSQAAKTFRMQHLGGEHLLGLLVAAELSLGAAAGLLGWRLAQSGRWGGSAKPATAPKESTSFVEWLHAPSLSSYSLARMAGFLGILALTLAFFPRLPLLAQGAAAAVYFAFALWTYAPLRKRLGRPRLWAEFAVIVLLSGLLLGGASGQPGSWWWAGLVAGASMVFRAAMVMAGFSVVSVELRNPRILAWFERRGMQGLPEALNLAFAALPRLTAEISEMRGRWKHPQSCLRDLVRTAAQLIGEPLSPPSVFLITGRPGDGKTTFAARLVQELSLAGLRPGGILAPGWWDGGQRAGFDLVDLSSGRKVRLAEAQPGASWDKPAARFRFRRSGWRFGHKALSARRLSRAHYCMVDEVGPLELRGNGWAPRLDELAEGRGPAVLILVVRESLLEDVCRRWNWQVEAVFEAGGQDIEQAAAAVRACCAQRAAQRKTEVSAGDGSKHGPPDSAPDGNAALSASPARAESGYGNNSGK